MRKRMVTAWVILALSSGAARAQAVENDTCESALELAAGHSEHVVQLGPASDSTDLLSGSEVFFSFTLGPGQRLRAVLDDFGTGLSAVISMAILSDCDAPEVLAAGGEYGEPYYFLHVGERPGRFVLAVYSLNDGALAALYVDIQDAPVGTEPTSLGRIKSLYER